MSKAKHAGLVWLSMAAAVAAGVALWWWWVSFDQPRIVPRPHDIMWDVVSLSARQDGVSMAPAVNVPDRHPLLRWAAFVFSSGGRSYQALAAAQLPFLALLMIAGGLVAWRIAGPWGGALAPWVTLLGPMSIGLAVEMNDLLALQALLMTALALVAWTDDRRRRLLGGVLFLPVCLGANLGVWFSSGLFFLTVFACGAGPFLAWRWATIRRADRPVRVQTALITLYALAALMLGVISLPALRLDYLAAQVARPMFQAKSVRLMPEAIWIVPSLWPRLLAGPVMCGLAVFATPLVWLRSTRRDLLAFLLGGTILPTLLLIGLNKRHDFYLASAVPLLYPLVAAGLAGVTAPSRRVVAAVVAVATLAAGWGWAVRYRGRDIDRYRPAPDAFRVLEDQPSYYLISPRAPAYSEAWVGRRAAAECTAHGRPIVFAEADRMQSRVPFYAWHADPRTRIGNVMTGPLPNPPLCLLVPKLIDEREVTSVADVVERFPARLPPLDASRTAAVQARLATLAGLVDRCRQVFELTGWILYRCGETN